VSLTQDIKEYALDLGYSKVGITTADPFPSYIEELNSRREMYAFYIEMPHQPLRGANPKSIMPSAKSIISVAYDYAKQSFPKELLGKIGRLYQARVHNAPAHRINGARYELMKRFLKQTGCRVGQRISLPERFAAARAGVTTYGKNNFAYAAGIGSFVVLGSFVVDIELDYDEPTIEMKCPEKCTACMDACPTQAIYEPLKLNPRRCILYNNAMTTGRPGTNTYIPPEIREKMGLRVHGCDTCQEVCPRNQRRLKANLPQNEFLVGLAKDFSLSKMLNMTDEFYATRVQPIMYNYNVDKKYLRRNAAIALGNQGEPEYIPDLAQALEDPEEVVRCYAAWALGRIGGGQARRILEASLSRETSDAAKTEIKEALAAERDEKSD
jgi:epoxyqueuosine reductase